MNIFWILLLTQNLFNKMKLEFRWNLSLPRQSGNWRCFFLKVGGGSFNTISDIWILLPNEGRLPVSFSRCGTLSEAQLSLWATVFFLFLYCFDITVSKLLLEFYPQPLNYKSFASRTVELCQTSVVKWI